MPKTYGAIEATVPVGADTPPDVPKAFEEFTDSLAGFPVAELEAGAKGKILVCNSSGVPQYVTPKGDLTLAEDGTVTVADGAITSRKLKPTLGQVVMSGGEAAISTTADLPGTSLAITPLVPSNLFVIASGLMGTVGGSATVQLVVDGVIQERTVQMSSLVAGSRISASMSRMWLIPLTAAAHTVKLQGFGSGEAKVVNASYVYALFAS